MKTRGNTIEFPQPQEDERQVVGVTIDDIIHAMSGYTRNLDEALLRAADAFAERSHANQVRLSGNPYMVHPRNVALILTELEMDHASIIAGLLHDVLEDTPAEAEQIEKQFGPEILFLVQGVTKLGRIPLASREETQMENIRRMLVATAKDMRVVIIKLCDRLHNMRTLRYLPLEKQLEISKSTMEIFAPLAHRMGIGRLKWELEDLAFSYLDPDNYRFIKRSVAEKRIEREGFIDTVIKSINSRLEEENILATVEGRVKHFFSIFRKMQRDNKPFEEIFDLAAVRILTDTQAHCYGILGVVHSIYPQVEGRFKDYISVPKANGYRSLHTTVLGPKGRLIEVQIRTHEMHRIAQEGVAAHWRYKEQRSTRKLGGDAKWLQELSAWLDDAGDPEEFYESLKIDAFSDEIFVYSPKGDLFRLPKGSTPIDFAYKIHTDLGNTCIGAKVGGKFFPLSKPLETGMAVEIVTSRTGHPSPDWLMICKTPRAKAKIRRYLLESRHDELLNIGRNLLNKELSRAGLVPNQVYASEKMQKIIPSLGFDSLEQLLIHIGFGRISTRQVISRFQRREPRQRKPHSEPGPSNLINVREIDGFLNRRAKCCNPVPGEAIVGIVTKTRGISIHKASCKSIQNFPDQERKIPLFWDTSDGERYSVEILVLAKDRERLLADCSSSISQHGTNILGCSTTAPKEQTARLNFSIEVMNIDQLNSVINSLIDIPGVRSVTRRRRAVAR